MTKQEEIRERTAKVLCKDNNYNWNKSAAAREKYLREAGDVLSYLHSQGVVIKVDGELPNVVIPRFIKQGIITDDDLLEYAKVTEILNRMEYIKAGCGFFEPLIEEGK